MWVNDLFVLGSDFVCSRFVFVLGFDLLVSGWFDSGLVLSRFICVVFLLVGLLLLVLFIWLNNDVICCSGWVSCCIGLFILFSWLRVWVVVGGNWLIGVELLGEGILKIGFVVFWFVLGLRIDVIGLSFLKSVLIVVLVW